MKRITLEAFLNNRKRVIDDLYRFGKPIIIQVGIPGNDVVLSTEQMYKMNAGRCYYQEEIRDRKYE